MFVAAIAAVLVATACGDGTSELQFDPGRAEAGDEAGSPDDPVPVIRVDQFGYRPDDPKVAVIAEPADDPGITVGERIEVRRAADDGVVFELSLIHI